MRDYSIQVHGIFHKNPDGTERQKIIGKCIEGEPIFFMPEPENPFDENAIKVLRGSGEQIGYVEEDKAAQFKKLLSANRIASARIDEIYGFEDKPNKQGVRLCIEIEPASGYRGAPAAVNVTLPPVRKPMSPRKAWGILFTVLGAIGLVVALGQAGSPSGISAPVAAIAPGSVTPPSHQYAGAAMYACEQWTKTHSKLAVDSFGDEYEVTPTKKQLAIEYRVIVEYRVEGSGLLMRSDCKYMDVDSSMILERADSRPQ